MEKRYRVILTSTQSPSPPSVNAELSDWMKGSRMHAAKAKNSTIIPYFIVPPYTVYILTFGK